MTDQPRRSRAVTFVECILLAFVLYVLAVGPLAFLEGAGVLNERAIEAIRPIYAPLRNTPVVWLLAGYERQSHAMGRRLRK